MLARQRHSSSAPSSVKLYQYEICPFCCKVKAFLDWQKIAYQAVEVNPLSKAEISFSKDYRKVPIAMLDGEQVNDSTAIIAALAAGRLADRALEEPEAARWLSWVDTELAVLLFPNITRSFGESFEAFGYISEVPTFSAPSRAANRAVGGLAMWLANGKLKKKYNITDERKQLLDTVRVWTDAVGKGPFLQGDSLGLADVAVYGVLSSIRGLATYKELMDASPDLARWSAQVQAAVGPSMRDEGGAKVPRTIGPMAGL